MVEISLNHLRPHLLFAVSLFLSRENRTPYLIDFGGACGESVFLLSKIFEDQIFERALVCESAQQVREASNWSYVNQIKFIDNLGAAIARPIDIFYLWNNSLPTRPI